jgi:hypothetical protein
MDDDYRNTPTRFAPQVPRDPRRSSADDYAGPGRASGRGYAEGVC